jgi:hypothetical protein
VLKEVAVLPAQNPELKGALKTEKKGEEVDK